jgi:ATP-dependent DNA ligase
MDHVLQLLPARCTKKLTVDEALAGKLPQGHIGEVKEDDCRYLLHVDPLGNGQNYLTSRRISKQTGRYVEKQDWCPFIRDYKFPKKMRGFVFDGGIYKPGLVSTDVVRAMRQGEGVSYVAWDFLLSPDCDYRELKQRARWGLLDCLAPEYPAWLTPSVRHGAVARLLKDVLAKGGEGIVTKDPEALYGAGWTKVKKKAMYDVIVLGYNEPDSEIYAAKGWIGQIICGQIEFESAVKHFQKVTFVGKENAAINIEKVPYYCRLVANVKNMTDELRARISANPDKYIGKVLQLSAQEQLKSGKLRNPSVSDVEFRDDKNPEDCLLRIGDEA